MRLAVLLVLMPVAAFAQTPRGLSSADVTRALGFTPLSPLAIGATPLTAFGAVCNGTTDDSAAISAAMAAGRPISIPAGQVCNGASISQGSISNLFVGPGQIKTSDGNLRAPVVSQIGSAPVRIGDWSSVLTAFNGDLSRAPNVWEHRVTGAATLGQPTSGYLVTKEASHEAGYFYNASGWNNSTANATGRTGAVGRYVNLFQAGQGDLIGEFVNCFIAAALPGATSFLAEPACSALAGQFGAAADGVYLQGIGDFDFVDNGHAISVIGSVFNFNRTNAGAALGQTWMGYRAQSLGATPIDAAFSAVGPTAIVIDAVDATTTAAMAAGAGQRIYGNSTNSGASRFPGTISLGTEWLDYSQSAGGWELIVGGVPVLTATPTGLRMPSHTPATSSEVCVAGASAWDASFEYRCVATNTWKRSALASF